MNSTPPPPATPKARLSVVLATDCYTTIRPVITCLRRQNVCDQLEVVLVAPRGGFRDLIDDDFRDFAALRPVEVASVQNLPSARAAGVRAATAPVFFIGETHTFPQPGWAEALIRAHEGPWVIVVPVILNAQERGIIYWAGYLLDYSHWGEDRPGGEISDPLIYNSAYKREQVLSLGLSLEELLDPYAEVLPALLARHGLKACLEPKARLAHLGVGLLRPYLDERFLVGLVIGGKRAARWSVLRRLVYCLGSPLVPLVLLQRLIPAFRRVRRRHQLPRGVLPAVLVGCIARAAGEMLAYIIGTPGWVEAAETEIEINRLRYCPGYTA